MKTSINIILLILFVSLVNVNCNSNQQIKSKQVVDSTKAKENGNSIDQSKLGIVKVITSSVFEIKSENQTIIDIRTPNEFKQGHIEGAVNINFFDKNFIEQISNYDKNNPLFIYCRSGNRTSSASRILSKSGFMQVYDLQGGVKSWVKSNNTLVK